MAYVLRWYGKQMLDSINDGIEKRLDIAANVIITEAKRSMGKGREPAEGAPVPRGWKRYGAKKGTKGRIKGHGSQRSAPGQPPAVQTGRLQNSITKDRPGPMRRRVGTNVKYGLFLEVGTRPFTITPKTKKMLSWIGPEGDRHFAKRVNHPGIKPRPWLRPAAIKSRAAIVSILGRPMKIVGGGGK